MLIVVLLAASVVCGGWQGSEETPAGVQPLGPLRMGSGIVPPEKISGPLPHYPAAARELGIEGVVIVEAIIDKRGDVIAVSVVKPLEESLDQAAMDTIRQWKFKPATRDGVPVDVYYTLTVSYGERSANKRNATALASRRAQLEKLSKKMNASDWQAALEISDKLAAELADAMTDIGGRTMLASITAHQAWLESVLGDDQEALWLWQIAQNLDTRASSSILLATSGAPTELLGDNRLRPPGKPPKGVPTVETGDEISPPRPLDWPFPKAPRRLKKEWAQDVLEVELFVDRTGRALSPRVLQGRLPGKIYYGLQAMREWRFEPASRGGEPVGAFFRVKVADEPRTDSE